MPFVASHFPTRDRFQASAQTQPGALPPAPVRRSGEDGGASSATIRPRRARDCHVGAEADRGTQTEFGPHARSDDRAGCTPSARVSVPNEPMNAAALIVGSGCANQ